MLNKLDDWTSYNDEYWASEAIKMSLGCDILVRENVANPIIKI